MPGADDEGVPAGEPVPVGAEHVGQRVLEEVAGVASPRAGRPDAPRTFGVPQVPEASMTARASDLVAVGEADQERRGVAAGGAQPVQAERG